MADITFNASVALKYDLHTNWTALDPVLRSGETAFAVIPAPSGSADERPVVLCKAGDGTSKYSELPFLSALSADVYDWAKAKTKPGYGAAEIDGLDEYIAGAVQDADTQYKLETDAENARKLLLYSRALGTEAWTLASTVELPAETVYTLAEGSANGTVSFNGENVPVHGLGAAAYKSDADFDAAGAASDALGQAKTYADGKDSAISAAQAAADAAQADADAVKTKLGELPDGASAETVVGYVDEKFAAVPPDVDYTVTVEASSPAGVAKRYRVAQVASGLSIDIDIPRDMVIESGTVETKTVSGAWGSAGVYLHLVLANASEDDVYIDVGSLIEYVTSGSAAGDMVVVSVSGDHKVTAVITDGTITLQKLHADVQSALGKAHEHANKAELDKIAGGDKAVWDAAAGKAHTHTNKSALDTVTAAKILTWDGAEQNAKDYADGLAASRGVPSSAASDAGKFLRVNSSGAAVWQAVANANGVNF